RKRQWAHPNEWLDKAVESKRVQAQKKPDVVPVRAGGVLAVRYDFRKRDPRPASLLVTLNSRDEQGVAPRTHTFAEDQFDPAGEGEFVTDVALDPLKNYDVYTSTVAGDPAVYSESRLRQMGPIAAGKGEPWFKRIPILVSLVVARLRGDR
ncbi:MAG: hypothetical protein QOJ89_2222, partial [bacterium]